MKATAFIKAMAMGLIILLVGAFVAPSHALADLNEGLVGYWSFNEGNGDTAYDYSGNGNHGIINGASWTTGISGGALEFDGVDDYVYVGDQDTLENTDQLTISLWSKFYSFGPPGSCGPNCMPLISKWYGLYVPGTDSYLLRQQDGEIVFAACDSDNINALHCADSMNTEQWYHIAIVFNVGLVYIFVDGGVPICTDTLVNPSVTSIANSTEPFKIGDWFHTHSSNYMTFHGIMDEVRIYNRALSEAEIESLYIQVGLPERSEQPLKPKTFALSQNYPNPFNPITQINYALPNESQVKLEVYNLFGQKVATLVDGKQKAGHKNARWDAGSLSSGIYFCRLKAGDFVQTRKMVLLR